MIVDRRTRITPILLFTGAFALYLAGLCTAPLPGDVSVYLRRAQDLDLDGFAQTHALFLVLVKAVMTTFPFLTPPTAGSLISAAAGAGAVVLVFLIGRALGARCGAALVGAVSLAVSHTLWFHSVIPEVYALNACMMAGMIFCGSRWAASHTAQQTNAYKPVATRWLFALGLVGGLACANHMLAALSLAVCVVWVLIGIVRGRARFKELAILSLGCALGLIPLAILIVVDARAIGIWQAVYMALVGGSGITGEAMISYGRAMGTFSPEQLTKSIALAVGAALYNFPGPALILVAVGVCHFRRGRDTGILLLLLLVVHLAFGVTYAIHEAWAFLLPVWVVCAVFTSLGSEVFLSRLTRPVGSGRVVAGICLQERLEEGGAESDRQRVTIADRTLTKSTLLSCPAVTILLLCFILPPALYLLASSAAGKQLGEKAGGRVLTGQEYARFYLWPPKNNATLEATWMRKQLQQLPEYAVAAFRPGYRALALYLQSVEGVRTDVLLIGLNDTAVQRALTAKETVYTDTLRLNDYISEELLSSIRITARGELTAVNSSISVPREEKP